LIISLIVAMDRRGGIGRDGGLPWQLPADLKRFRELTMGHHLIVGRKTYASIGRPLRGRIMIVVSRDPGYHAAGCEVTSSVDQALARARARGEDEVFIGGGAEIYQQTLARADRIYLTLVEAEIEADVFFPPLSSDDWIEREQGSHPSDANHAFEFSFKLLVRKPNQSDPGFGN
jgi:dihydrofolate reductase